MFRLMEATVDQVGVLFINKFIEPMISRNVVGKENLYKKASLIFSKFFSEIEEYKNYIYPAQITSMISHLETNPTKEELKAWKNSILFKNDNEVSDEATLLSIRTWMTTKPAKVMLDIIYDEAEKAGEIRNFMRRTGCSLQEAFQHFHIIDLRREPLREKRIIIKTHKKGLKKEGLVSGEFQRMAPAKPITLTTNATRKRKRTKKDKYDRLGIQELQKLEEQLRELHPELY